MVWLVLIIILSPVIWITSSAILGNTGKLIEPLTQTQDGVALIMVVSLAMVIFGFMFLQLLGYILLGGG